MSKGVALAETRLGGFGQSSSAEAETAGRDAVRAALGGRPYRRAMRREEALAELCRYRGTQFDATVVDALLALEQSRVQAA